MKIVVYGTGGVGGFFGGRIANAGYDVTFIARVEHLKAIKRNGLQVKSIDGSFTVYPNATDAIEEVKEINLILLGVKSWQITDVAKKLKPVIGKETMVLPLQNGADNADRLREVLPHHNVLAGLCKVVSKVEAPGVINHFDFVPEIVFGEYDNAKTDRILQVKKIFDDAGFKNRIADDIHLDIWRKFIFIATVSGIAALTRVVYGELKGDKAIQNLFRQNGEEILQIANTKGIALTKKDIDIALDWVEGCDYNTTASMQRDIMEGKPSELENFNGYIVKQGKELSIPTPVNEFVYNCLLPQERIARRAKA